MDVVIIGAGGHGRVVLDILRAGTKYRPFAFLDADTTLLGTRVGGVSVMGNIHQIAKLKQQRVRHAIVAIGDNRARLSCADYLRAEGIELVNAVHPTAVVSTTASMGNNIVIAAGAVVSTDTRIGDSVILNTSCVVDHECEIAAGAHVCPTAALAGRVRVARGALIGLGAKVIPCISIGEGATIGAGAVVIRDVPAGTTAVGVPAHIIKPATTIAA